MTRRLILLLVVLPLLAACAGQESPGRQPEPSSHVDVDTPQLRQLKQQAGVAPCPPSDAEPVAGGLPDITLPCLGGGRDVSLAGLRGPMVVNLWAQWCGPCREELPFYQQLHERAGDKLQVVGLDWLDTQPGRALQLAESTGVSYPLIADPDGATEVPLRVRGLPGVVFVDSDGRVVDTQFLVIRSYDQLRDLVADNLGVALPAAG